MWKNKTIIISGVLLSFIFIYWLLPYPHVGNDLHLTYSDDLVTQLSIPYAWGSRMASGLGQYSIFILWSWPIHFIFGVLGAVGLSHTLLNQLILFTSILFGMYGITKVLTQLGISNIFVRVCGVLVFIANTYTLLLVDGGQLTLFLSYILFPWLYITYKNALELFSLITILPFIGVITLISIFDIRILYIALIFLMISITIEFIFTANKRKSFLFSNIKLGVISILFLFGFHAYWLIPAFFVRAPELPGTLSRVSQVSFLNFTSITHALFLQQPHWYKNVFGQVNLPNIVFFGFPLAVLISPLVSKVHKNILFWLTIFIFSVFLTKGSNPPLSFVYPWLFEHLPGFSLFRDSTKFFFLVGFSGSILLSISLHRVVELVPFKIKIDNHSLPLIPLLFSAYWIFLMSPVYTGRMTGTFSYPRYQTEYNSISNSIKSDMDFSRIMWLPNKPSLAYSSFLHPNIEASEVVTIRPFAIGVVGNYELFNFLRDAPFMDHILSISGIKYVGYPYPDEKRTQLKEDEKNYYHTFLSQLTNSEWSSGQISKEPIPVITTKSHKDHIFLAPNHYYVIGSDRLYWDLDQIPSFDLSKNALTFAEERKSEISPNSSIILYKKEKIDVAMTQVSTSSFIFPSKNMPFEPKEEGWWKREGSDLVKWRAFLQEKYAIDNLDFDYGGGWAIAEGQQELEIKDERIEKGKLLFVRLMTSTKGGKVEFWQGDSKIGEITTKVDLHNTIDLTTRGWNEIPDNTNTYEDTNVSWYESSILVNDEPLTVKTSGDINVINAFAILTEDEWRIANKHITSYQIYDWDVIPEIEKEHLFTATAPGNVTYERLSPVHYKVRVEGITKPQTVVFSEAYDPLWQLNGQKPLSLYSLLNGFPITENGEYDLYFSAQKYVNYGLVISGTTIISLIILLLFIKRGTMKK